MIHLPSPQSSNEVSAFLAYLNDNFAFYRSRFARTGLHPNQPYLTVLDHAPVLSDVDYNELAEEAYLRLATSHFLTDLSTGTTAKRKTRYTTGHDDSAEAVLCERFFRQCGLQRTDRVVALDIDSADIYLFYGDVLRELGITAFSFASVPCDFSESLAPLLALSPTVLITVPSIFARLLPFLRQAASRGQLRSLRKVVYIGESMSPSLRAQASLALGVELFSFYGSTEIGSMAGECRAHAGMHIYNDSVFPTILHPIPTSTGVTGEALWTTLHFRDHPLLKYATRDSVTISIATCACGMPGPRLLDVERLEDQFVLYGHKFRYAAFLDSLSRVGITPEFLEIHVADSDNAVHLTFRMPRSLRSHSRRIQETLFNTDEVSYFHERGFATHELVFSDHPSRNGRKLPRVLDRRNR